MFYDLNIALPESAGKPNGHVSSQDWAQIVQAIEQARAFGYSVVALNQTVQGKVTPAHLNVWTSIPNIKGAVYSWDTENGSRLARRASDKVPRASISVLRRLTSVVTEASQGHGLTSNGNPTLKEYDIVAVRPASEQLMHAASSGTWDAIDIISLDMGSRWGFFAKHKAVGQALSMGYAFEISYAPALMDASSRRQWVSNAASIVRVTRGKSVIWTSGSSRAFDIRPPYDIINLGSILDLNGDLSKRALTTNPRSTLVHAYTRTETLRAVIAVAPAPPADAAQEEGQPARKKAKSK
ncbi:RNA-binding RNA processing protein rpp1 [Dipsacomyces acuminosporus]|nr:RNA-binding RNA processing protein rpp1 [Dipsacomyces acuminosporus]